MNLISIIIAHVVVTNQTFPKDMSFKLREEELKAQGHSRLLMCCEYSAVQKAYDREDIGPAIEELFDLFTSMKEKYVNLHNGAPLPNLAVEYV